MMTRLLLLIAKGVIGILRTTFTSKASIALADELERELKELTSGLPPSADAEHAVRMLPRLVDALDGVVKGLEAQQIKGTGVHYYTTINKCETALKEATNPKLP